MAWRRPSQQLKSPTTLTRRAFGAQTTKATPCDAFHLHRMSAELVVEREVVAFAEQVEIELGEHGRKAVRILQLDLAVAEAGAQPVVLGIVERPRKETGRVDALELAFAAVADREHPAGIGQKNAHDGAVIFGMRPEIMERVGIAAGNDLAGACGEFAHCTTPRSARMRHAPSSGICVQAGRLVSSYSIS